MNQTIVAYAIADAIEEKRRDLGVVVFVNDRRADIDDLEVLRDRILNGKDEVTDYKFGNHTWHFTTV